MLDLSYFQNNGNVSTQTFTNAGSWVTWLKPRGAKFINIMCIGSGGGGGGGLATGSAIIRSGGSGGGGGAIVTTTFQASILPDILYIYTGVGGTGGTGGTPAGGGGVGEKSYVCITPSVASVAGIVVTSGNISARGGIAGTAVATTTSPAGETVATVANAIFLNLGAFLATAGSAGGLGAASSFAPSNPSTFLAEMVGGGGAGNAAGTTTQNTGAGFNAVGPYTQALGGLQSVPRQGSNGVTLYKPILGFQGGMGGGSGGAGAGGNGGNGSYGCGGGGGGAGVTSAGNGGNGGNGLIIITTSF
jgi:hypothetical protein